MSRHKQAYLNKYQQETDGTLKPDLRVQLARAYVREQLKSPEIRTAIRALPTTQLPFMQINPPKVPCEVMTFLRTTLGRISEAVLAMEKVLKPGQVLVIVRDVRRDLYYPVIEMLPAEEVSE